MCSQPRNMDRRRLIVVAVVILAAALIGGAQLYLTLSQRQASAAQEEFAGKSKEFVTEIKTSLEQSRQ